MRRSRLGAIAAALAAAGVPAAAELYAAAPGAAAGEGGLPAAARSAGGPVKVPLGRIRAKLDGRPTPLPQGRGLAGRAQMRRRVLPGSVSVPLGWHAGQIPGGAAAGRTDAYGLPGAAQWRRDIAVTMLDVLLYVNLTVGTAAAAETQLRVQVDTGSSSLAVPTPQCDNCNLRCPSCAYDSAASPTSRVMPCATLVCQAARSTRRSDCWRPTAGCAFRLGFADGSAAHGDIMLDTVSLGGMVAPEVAFARIWNETPAGGFSSLDVDGIIGLADRSLNRGGAREEMPHEALLRRAGLPPVFALQVGTHAQGTGLLTLGGVDTELLGDHPLRWTPLLAGGWYVVQLNCVTVGGVPVSRMAEDFGDLTIVDSGTTMTLLPYGVMQNIKRVLRDRWGHLPHVSAPNPYSLFNAGQCFSDINPDLFPPVTFSFAGGAVVEVTPRQYFATAVQDNTTFYCFGLIGGDLPSTWHISDQQTILGDTFMAAAYVAFDRGGRRLGFGGKQVDFHPEHPRCAAPPPEWALDPAPVQGANPQRAAAAGQNATAMRCAQLLLFAALFTAVLAAPALWRRSTGPEIFSPRTPPPSRPTFPPRAPDRPPYIAPRSWAGGRNDSLYVSSYSEQELWASGAEPLLERLGSGDEGDVSARSASGGGGPPRPALSP